MHKIISPAHETKHIQRLFYPFRGRTFVLNQLDNGQSNGTALWLGAQCLSLYLADINLKQTSKSGRARPAVIELGSGIGLTALVLSSLGWDVLATDIPCVVSSVLSQNISQNASSHPSSSQSGLVEIRELDWTVRSEEWTWDHREIISSASRSSVFSVADNECGEPFLRPPFDLIVSADTLYSPDLVEPLLRTLHSLSAQSGNPLVYLCLERRDPALVDLALAQARDRWHFRTDRVPDRKVWKTMQKGGINWPRTDWEGVEIWKLVLSSASITPA